jgi:hypothetical protein
MTTKGAVLAPLPEGDFSPLKNETSQPWDSPPCLQRIQSRIKGELLPPSLASDSDGAKQFLRLWIIEKSIEGSLRQDKKTGFG